MLKVIKNIYYVKCCQNRKEKNQQYVGMRRYGILDSLNMWKA